MDVDLRGKVNESFEAFFSSHKRDLVSYGGAGAGKSWAAAQKLILKCFKYPKRKVIITRKYGPSLRHTCFDMVCDILKDYGLWDRIKSNQTEMSLQYPNGSSMLFVPIVDSGPSREPAGRIKSFTDITDIWFEEPTELSQKEYQQASLRLRGQELKEGYRQRILTFNPIDKNHWIHTVYFDGNRGDRQHYIYRDNKFIDKDYVKELLALKETDPIAYQVYGLGEWGVMGNQIYKNYEVKEFELERDKLDTVIAGADFGFEQPSAFGLIGLKEKEVLIRAEIYERRLTTADFIERIMAIIEGAGFKEGEVPIFCDPSQPGTIEEMERAGLLVYPANNDVLDGIATVKGFRLIFHTDCFNGIKEVAGYKWREDRHGNVLDMPLKFNDHVMDLVRYALHTYMLSESGPVEEIEPEPYMDEFDREGKF